MQTGAVPHRIACENQPGSLHAWRDLQADANIWQGSECRQFIRLANLIIVTVVHSIEMTVECTTGAGPHILSTLHKACLSGLIDEGSLSGPTRDALGTQERKSALQWLALKACRPAIATGWKFAVGTRALRWPLCKLRRCSSSS